MQRCRHSYLDRIVCAGDCQNSIVETGFAVIQELFPITRFDLLRNAVSLWSSFGEGSTVSHVSIRRDL